MTQEFEEKIVLEPKSFGEALEHQIDTLHRLDTLHRQGSHRTSDSAAVFLREIRSERALKMLYEADTAYRRQQFDAAWYYLVEAANAIGYLVASEGAVYPRDDEEQLRESLAKSGKKGGTQKGANAKALQDRIAAMLIDAALKDGLKNRVDLRRKYNLLTAEMDGYHDADRKWLQLQKRDDIQELLKPSKK